MDAFGPPRKRVRADFAVNGDSAGVAGLNAAMAVGDIDRRYGAADGGLSAGKDLGAAAGGKTKACTKFFSTSGCPYGEGCHFSHYVPGGINALGLAPLTNLGSSSSLGVGSMRKSLGGTPVVSSVSEQGSSLGGFKTRLCKNYDTPEGCRFGEKCHFAHGDNELRKGNGAIPMNRESLDFMEYNPLKDRMAARAVSGGIYGAADPRLSGMREAVGRSHPFREPTPPGLAAAASFGAHTTAKISIDAALAGAVIGKSGAHVKHICSLTGAKLSIRDHENDPKLKNVEMEGSLEQIQQAGQLVHQLLLHKDTLPMKPSGFGSHNYKTKMCENFSQGTCTFGDRCHFAHGANELREAAHA